MKIFLPLLCFGLLLCACANEQKQFCAQAAQSLCAKCESCGSYQYCGLLKTADKASCVAQIGQVCAAYDGIYTRESARSCLEQLGSLQCGQLKSSGKPEICTRLF